MAMKAERSARRNDPDLRPYGLCTDRTPQTQPSLSLLHRSLQRRPALVFSVWRLLLCSDSLHQTSEVKNRRISSDASLFFQFNGSTSATQNPNPTGTNMGGLYSIGNSCKVSNSAKMMQVEPS
nr:hypothetical protein Iba_chr10eCG14060 [Ipomoea batatas]